jgi:hypothetical protein
MSLFVGAGCVDASDMIVVSFPLSLELLPQAVLPPSPITAPHPVKTRPDKNLQIASRMRDSLSIRRCGIGPTLATGILGVVCRGDEYAFQRCQRC